MIKYCPGRWILSVQRELQVWTRAIYVSTKVLSASQLMGSFLTHHRLGRISCITTVSNRSKHIDVLYHFARERVARKDVKIAYVKTNDMLADMLTKPVDKAKLDLCKRGIGMG